MFQVLKGVIEGVVGMFGYKMVEIDFEFGVNLMVFFCCDWDELIGVFNFEKFVDGLLELVE